MTDPGAAQKITDFSADQVVIGAKGKVEQERKLSVEGDRIRIDKVVPADAKVTTIFRRERKLDPTLFETPKGFKKAATLKDVLPSDSLIDDDD
jgi:hypothetical protein